MVAMASAAQAAPANLPEAGRCVKVATGTGAYGGASCLLLAAPGRGKYEWTPAGATEKQAFSGSGLETKLTTAGHPTITCVAANIAGEWTGPKTASVSVELQGCSTPSGAQCQTVTNPQNRSEIKLTGVEGELGFIRYEEVEGKLIVVPGFDLKPQPPLTELAAYECTGSSEVGHIEGSVIGKVKPFDKMTTEFNLLYLLAKSGAQVPEEFQEGPKDTLTTTFTSGLETLSSDPSALNVKGETGSNGAPLEIKAKP
jgi:hypothetical protein